MINTFEIHYHWFNLFLSQQIEMQVQLWPHLFNLIFPNFMLVWEVAQKSRV
jgi:hypothetical protein